jgi:hypothetical protein
MTNKTINIYQKLLCIQKRVIGLGKDKAGFNYRYVTGDKVIGEIKPIMNELGLILKQEVLSIENIRQDYNTKLGAKSEILSKVMMRFTWVDCETGEKDENLFGANGQNDFDKGCGSAFTYAERYFLLKFFHIATDEDDIDNPDRQTTAVAQPNVTPFKPQERHSEPIIHPDLLPGTDKWLVCVNGIAEGKATVEKIKLKNTLSVANEKLLEKEAQTIKQELDKIANPKLK